MMNLNSIPLSAKGAQGIDPAAPNGPQDGARLKKDVIQDHVIAINRIASVCRLLHAAAHNAPHPERSSAADTVGFTAEVSDAFALSYNELESGIDAIEHLMA